ncbi:MAG: prepilin-type N-terminal cleavage/methylation domain-containing protein [Planctomycetota bacterium]
MTSQFWACFRHRDGIEGERGFTLLEIMVVMAIIAILATMSVPFYQSVVKSAEIRSSVADLETMSRVIDAYIGQHGYAPASLSDVGIEGFTDPWGRPYHYLRLANAPDAAPPMVGAARTGADALPVNSDYDLFTIGADGEYLAELSAPESRDDVIRADNGSFHGAVFEYHETP